MTDYMLDKRIQPGRCIVVQDDGWTYSTYQAIEEEYQLKRWKWGDLPVIDKTYKVIHIIDPQNGKFGRAFDKVVIEDLESPHQQYIIGFRGIEYVERELNIEGLEELIKKNKEEKPQVFFNVDAL